MKVVLAGYYGRNEKCDDLLECAVKQSCRSDIEWIRIEDINRHNDIDMVVLGGGSLLGHGIYIVDNLCIWLKEHTGIPFHILGVGARDLNLSQAAPGVKYLFDRAETCMVRGHSSRKRLSDIGIHIPEDEVGDPIFLLKSNGKPRRGGYVGGVVRPVGNYYFVESALIEASERERKPLRLFSFSEPQMDNQFTRSASAEKYDLGLVESYNAIRDSYLWIGNRLHAFCVALNEGVPTIGIDIEFDKVKDVCSSLDCDLYIHDSSLPQFPLASFSLYAVEMKQVFKARDSASVLRERLKKRLGEITK